MAELALGIVGVVPLIGAAIKAYKQVNGTLKHFRHSSSEVKKVHKVLRIQRQVFANECGLWLRFIMDDDEVASEMASNPSHDGWSNPSLEKSFRSRLKKNYDPWFEINKDISDNVETLETQLSSYEASAETKSKDGKLKKVLKRTKEGVKVAFNASDFEDTIEKLRSSNNDLKGLREQIGELHKPKSQSSKQARCLKSGDWATHIRIRRASKALYEALVRTWNCGQPGHLGHAVKLFVETHRVEGDIQMNLAIVCRSHTQNLIQSTLVQLEVRSQNLEWIEQPRIHGQLSLPVDIHSEPRKRLKVVRFAESVIQELHTSPTSTSEQNRACGSCDLRSSKDICKELTQQLNASCLGHIDVQSDEAFRHSFYPAKNDLRRTSRQPSPSEDRAVTMDEVLDDSRDSSRDFFSTVDRLKLARTLVSAVLKFHSTPWLGDFWRLRDLAFFRASQGEGIDEALRTLHVGVEVAQRQLDSMEDIQSSADCSGLSQVSEDERLFCGINNLTLHSLGVALLQIDRWTRVEPGDVLEVRKMALRPSPLGARYQEITQKCLRCDFGYGSDLTRPRLQQAVYENVVGALETMISSLDLADSLDLAEY